MKRIILVVAVFVFFIACNIRLNPTKTVNKLGSNPYLIVNGKVSKMSIVDSVDTKDVASVATYYGKEAREKFGEQAKDGAIIVETKGYAKEKYQKNFKGLNKDYKIRLEAEGNDKNFQYILNGKPLLADFEGLLSGITADLLERMEVISSAELTAKFNISGKSLGILITALPPKDLYKGKENFNVK